MQYTTNGSLDCMIAGKQQTFPSTSTPEYEHEVAMVTMQKKEQKKRQNTQDCFSIEVCWVWINLDQQAKKI